MYEIRTFYLSSGIKVSDLLSLLENVCDKFQADTSPKKEVIEALRSSIIRTSTYSFALYHEVNSRTKDGVYYEFGLMNVDGFGIISAMILQVDKSYHTVSIIPQDLKIDGFALHSTIPSWNSKLQGAELTNTFDEIELLIINELERLEVKIKSVKSESKWLSYFKNAGCFLSSIFIFVIWRLWTNAFVI